MKHFNFFDFLESFLNDENHHQLTTGHLKCKYLLICMRNIENCEMPKNGTFSQDCSHENLYFLQLSGKPLKMMKISSS